MAGNSPSPLLKQVARLDDATLDEALSDLFRARLVVRSGLSGNVYAFRHALIQDVAYQALLTGKRRNYHRMIAEALIADHPSVVETQPELIARHLSEADLAERALPFWKLAAERALARSANFEAVDHCENALRLVTRLPDGEARARESLPVHLLMGRALANAGRMPEAMIHSRAASNEARAQGDVVAFAEAALMYDNARFLSNEPSRDSIALLKEAKSLVGAADPQIAVSYLEPIGPRTSVARRCRWGKPVLLAGRQRGAKAQRSDVTLRPVGEPLSDPGKRAAGGGRSRVAHADG